MTKPIIMPKFGMDQTESTIVEWLKREGDRVEKGEPLLVVMTDKVNMEVEAPASGILASIQAHADETVPVTSVIGYILEPDDEGLAGSPSPQSPGSSRPDEVLPAASATPVAARVATSAGVDVSKIAGSGPRGRVTKEDVEHFLAQEADTGGVRATPAARRLARESGLDLQAIQGTGPRGRVQEADVRTVLAREPGAEATAAGRPETEKVKIVRLSGLRRTIARRMQQSAQSIPDFTLSSDFEAGPLLSWRDQVNEWLRGSQQEPVSLTAFLLKAVAWALRRHPWLNAHFHGEELHLWHRVHLGVAVAREQGLIVPVIRDADQKGVVALGTELRALSDRARAEKLHPDEVKGATFTVSNLGMFGIDRFRAIIDPPQVGILAFGRVCERVVVVNGQPAVRALLTATLSADHRAVDGAQGARFLQDLGEALQAPGLLLA